MATIAKTVVATGVSQGIGFEAVKQLLAQSQPYKIILGARDTQRTKTAYDGLSYDKSKSSVTILPAELSQLKSVRTFARQTLEKLGADKIDYLLLNAGAIKSTEEKGTHGSRWCEPYLVNHLSQHYLVHLLREKLVESKSRIVFVSSGAVRNVDDTSVLDADIKDGSGQGALRIYADTKFIQLLGAHWWRRQLKGQCVVIAVSPGMIPGTNLAGPNGFPKEMLNHPDAKTVPEGGENVLRAFWRDDLPEDPEQIFLTSWGEWWPKDVYGKSLDKELQDKFCPSKEELEKEEGLAA